MIKREVKRDVKFRAWDKKRKEWYGKSNPHSLTFYGFAIFGECTLLCTPSADHLVDLEITQYTGLKDKKGVEIYEGDVIDWGVIPLVIEFSQRTASFVCSRPGGAFVCYGLDASHAEKEIEVIGNVYENPNLMERK